MAYERDAYRHAVTSLVLGRLGVSSMRPRIWAGQVLSATEEALLNSLPVVASGIVYLSASSPAPFMPDLHPPDSPSHDLQ